MRTYRIPLGGILTCPKLLLDDEMDNKPFGWPMLAMPGVSDEGFARGTRGMLRGTG